MSKHAADTASTTKKFLAAGGLAPGVASLGLFADDGRDRARSAVAGRVFPFVRPTNGLTTGHNLRGCAESVSEIGEV
jgi:hypothetical protein